MTIKPMIKCAECGRAHRLFSPAHKRCIKKQVRRQERAREHEQEYEQEQQEEQENVNRQTTE